MVHFARELGKAFFVGIMIFIVITIVEYATGSPIQSIERLVTKFGYNQLYAVPLYLANMPFFYFMIKKYGTALFKWRPLFMAYTGALGLTLSALFFINMFIVVVIKDATLNTFLENQQLDQYLVGTIISLVVTTIFYVFHFYKLKKDSQVTRQKIIAKTASAQFDALKNQLDPHFLFNSLNVLTSLIEENPQAATKFTTSLSKVYRYVLEQKNKELVTLEEELKFARLYMSLIKMRFEDSIVFTVPEHVSNSEAKVVPLSLQLLLENAVKHNQVTPTKKLHIQIYEKQGHLIVENNLQPKKVLRESSGVGLQNIYQRYRLLTDRKMEVDKDNRTFKVSIPLLQNISVVRKTQDSYISDKRLERAKEYVEKLKGFYVHLTIYLIFIPVFIYLNWRSGTDFPWAVFPIAGWGLGVLGHASEIFDWNPFLNKRWEERKIRELMDKDE